MATDLKADGEKGLDDLMIVSPEGLKIICIQPPYKVSYRVPFGEAKNGKALPIMLVFHLFLIHFGERNNVTTVAKTCKGKCSCN